MAIETDDGKGKTEDKAKATEKVEVKKLDDVKDTPENKAAIAEAEGRPLVEETGDGKRETGEKAEEKKKTESKPAVAKDAAHNSVPSKKGTDVPASSSKKEKKGEVKVELEREYVVPLKKGVLNVPHYRRAKKAVRVLKEFIVKHMGVRDRDLRKVKVDINLNNEIWFRGIKKPMNKVKVKAKKIDGIVYVELAEIPAVVGYKIAREEKRAAAAASAKVKAPKHEKEKVEEDADKDGVADKTEEKEDVKAGSEMGAKIEKSAAKNVQHSTKGSHAKKTMPVRKSLKK